MNLVTASKRTAILHYALGVAALAALVMSRIPSLAAYGNVLAILCGTTGATAHVIAAKNLPAWALTLINAIAPSLINGASVADKAEVKS